MVNDTQTETLAERVERQERLIEALLQEQRIDKANSLEAMLGQLRLRGAVLMFAGEDLRTLAEHVQREQGSEVWRDLNRHLFVLDNAPVEPSVKVAMREALHPGQARW